MRYSTKSYFILPDSFRMDDNWPGYGVDDQGNVYSVHNRCIRILKPWRKSSGHLSVSLRKGGKTYKVAVHGLVLENFNGPRPEMMEVCHNNGDPSDNKLSNLRWDTRRENSLDIFRASTLPKRIKLNIDLVKEIRDLYGNGKTLTELAKIYGVTVQNILMVVKRKSWKFVQ